MACCLHLISTVECEAAIGGLFTLTDKGGNTVTDKDFRGQYLLIYFGYSNSPGLTHDNLMNIDDDIDNPGDDSSRVTPIFITVDPERDSPSHLKEYATYFHPRLRALTCTREQIKSVAKAYRVYYSKARAVPFKVVACYFR